MDNRDYVVYIIHDKHERSTKHGTHSERGSTDSHAHFWYCVPSVKAHLIIHGVGRSLITYSLVTAELELGTDEVPLLQVGQLSSYLQCHMQLYSCGLEEAGPCGLKYLTKEPCCEEYVSTDFTLVFKYLIPYRYN